MPASMSIDMHGTFADAALLVQSNAEDSCPTTTDSSKHNTAAGRNVSITRMSLQVPLLMPIQHIAAGWAHSCKRRLLQHHVPMTESSATNLSQLSSNPTQRPLATVSAGMTAADTSYNAEHCPEEPVIAQNLHDLAWAAALPSVVLVSSGSGWASGIVLSRDGHILTNAHVVNPSSSRFQTAGTAGDGIMSSLQLFKVRVSSGGKSKDCWHLAEVVYSFRHALDLAILRIKAAPHSLKLQPAVLHPGVVTAGQPVAVIGHALFSPKWDMQPTLTAGNITKVNFTGYC